MGYASLLNHDLTLQSSRGNLSLIYRENELDVLVGGEPTPEPGTWALAFGGAVALFAGRKLRSKARRQRA